MITITIGFRTLQVSYRTAVAALALDAAVTAALAIALYRLVVA